MNDIRRWRDDGTEGWETWPGTGLAGRDLGLGEASAGRLSAQHVRATGADAGLGEWHCYDLDFEFLYLIGGALTLEDHVGAVHELVAGSAFAHPAFWLHRDHFRSGDLDVIRITAPAGGTRYEGRDAALPAHAEPGPGTGGHYTHARDDVPAPDPRHPGFVRRELGTERATDGRFGLAVVGAAHADAATGWHEDPAAQWNVVVAGTGFLLLEDEPARPLTTGVSYALGAGERHAVRARDADLALLRLTTPAA